jgi:hypothetical protein
VVMKALKPKRDCMLQNIWNIERLWAREALSWHCRYEMNQNSDLTWNLAFW